MKNLESIADLMSTTAVTAARKISEPLEEKVKSIGRSIKSIDRIARESLEGSDQTKDGLEREVQSRATEIMGLKTEFATYATAFSDALKGLGAEQDQLRDRVETLPDDTFGREVNALKREFMNHKGLIEETIGAMQDAQAGLDELVRQVPTSTADDIDEIRVKHEESIGTLVEDFCNLKGEYEDRFKVIDEEQQRMIDQGSKALEQVEQLTVELNEAVDKAVKGDAGTPGEPGEAGQRGPKGEPGSMSAPERWSKEKLYKPGATAMHRGGTWYCEITTVDEPGESPGWVCLANGVDVGESYVEDGVRVDVYADGQRVEYRIMPRMMGVYREDEGYIKNDYVTWNGSMYRAMTDGSNQHPGKKLPDGVDTEWACDVKRGPRGSRGPAGDPADAAAIVYEQLQKDYDEATGEVAEYLEGIAL